MRLWHLIVAVLVLGSLLGIVRDPSGRIALVVFVTGLAEFVCGLAAVMALFRTVGAIGEANGPVAYAEAICATALVLLIATLVMTGLLWVGAWLVQAAVATIAPLNEGFP